MNAQEHIYARLAADPQLFKPEPGESLVGVVVGRYTVHHDSYGDSPALRIWDGTTEWRWHAYGTVASGFVEECDPKFGDWVGVLYVGQEGSGTDAIKKWRTAHVPAHFADSLGDSPVPAGCSPAPAAAIAGVPSAVPSPEPPTEERIPNEEPGEPKITHAQAQEIVAMFESFADDGLRKQTKQEFVELFGKPVDLPGWRYEEALGFIREARSGDVF